ncbi:MAG: hypothetical protein WCI11_16820 [Candidatus Methylumidiphilus sp.]
MHKDSWLRYCALALALTAYGGSVGGIEPVATPAVESGAGQAATPQAGASSRRKVKQVIPPAQPKLNGLAQTATNAGIVDCVGRIQQVTDFLTANSKSGAFLFIAPTDTNRRIASASLEIQAGAVSSYASASFAPAGNNACSAMYETVSYWANQCEEVAKRAFPTFPNAGKLGGSIIMLDGGPNLKMFLMPAGQGCLSIKKEMVY